MDLSIASYPDATFLPENLARLKRFLRIEHNDEDDDLKELMLAAATQFTRITGREILYTIRRLAFSRAELYQALRGDGFAIIELPYPPLLEVQYVLYTDDTGEYYLTVGDHFLGDISSTPGYVQFTPAGVAVLDRATINLANPIKIIFSSGCAVDAAFYPDAVPPGIRHWIREATRWLYESKGVESRDGFPKHLIAMADQWRVGRWQFSSSIANGVQYGDAPLNASFVGNRYYG